MADEKYSIYFDITQKNVSVLVIDKKSGREVKREASLLEYEKNNALTMTNLLYQCIKALNDEENQNG